MRAVLPCWVVNGKLNLKFRAPNFARDSGFGIAPCFRYVAQLDGPERPDFCLGCTGGGLVDQCFRAVSDALDSRRKFRQWIGNSPHKTLEVCRNKDRPLAYWGKFGLSSSQTYPSDLHANLAGRSTKSLLLFRPRPSAFSILESSAPVGAADRSNTANRPK